MLCNEMLDYVYIGEPDFLSNSSIIVVVSGAAVVAFVYNLLSATQHLVYKMNTVVMSVKLASWCTSWQRTSRQCNGDYTQLAVTLIA